MYISETDFKTGIELTEPVNVDISHHVNRRTGFSVPENPLKVRLYSQVGDFTAVKDMGFATAA